MFSTLKGLTAEKKVEDGWIHVWNGVTPSSILFVVLRFTSNFSDQKHLMAVR